MPPVNASISGRPQITASVGETKIDVSVSGGVGPTGSQGPAGPSGASNWSEIVGKPATFPPSTHQHVVADVTGLQAALDGKQASGSYVLTTDARLSDARQPLSHNHDASAINAGTLSADRLPLASANTRGAVRIGSGISIDNQGVISASSGYTLPTASTTTLGGILVDGTTFGVDGNGVLVFGSSVGLDQDVSTSSAPTFDGLTVANAIFTVDPQTNSTVISNIQGGLLSSWNITARIVSFVGDEASSIDFTNATVSGLSYNDLDDLPTFDGSYASLTGLPTLFDGDYTSLTNRPGLFDGVYSSLTGLPTLGTAASQDSTAFASATHASSHAANGADALYDQNLNTTDSPTFAGLTCTGNLTFPGNGLLEDNGVITCSGINVGDGYSSDLSGSDVNLSECTINVTDATITGLSYTSLTNLPTLGTAAAQDSTAFAAATHGHAWSDITSGVPSTFAPSAHSHGAGDITSGTLSASLLPTSGVAAGTYTSVTVDTYGRVTAGSTPSIAYSSLTGLPTLGGAASLNVGTTAGTVAAGDHTHSQLHDRSHAITSTSDHTATNWRLFHSNGSGQVVELAFGASGTVLQSNGSASAPTWETVTTPTYAVRSDAVSSTAYTGRAVSGSATSASVWKIRRTVYSSAGAVSSTATATNVRWDDRLTATYA